MKKIKLFIILLLCLFIVNVKADMGPPFVVTHNVMVTNKNGAVCYEEAYNSAKKTNVTIPYGTTLRVYDDVVGSGYIFVSSYDESKDETTDKYNCYVKSSDISAKDQNFSLNNNEVTKLTAARKAIVLATGGLNMRKGPSVTYSKILTIPEKTIVTLTHSAGSYWYYTTYNGKSGWITGMDGYLGYDDNGVLIDGDPVKIYSSNGKTVLGTIPANTEITQYIKLSGAPYYTYEYYVIYNGIKGYVQHMGHKTDGSGKIKLTEDYQIYENEKPVKKLSKGQELEYTIVHEYVNGIGFYVPEKNETISFYADMGVGFEYIKEAKTKKKTSGYIGEGLFGEAKQETSEEPVKEEEPKKEEDPVIEKEDKLDITTIIIIALLAGIFACLTALVIIKLVNGKKKTEVVKPVVPPKEESEFEKVSDKEIAKAREEILKEEANKIEENDHNKEV